MPKTTRLIQSHVPDGRAEDVEVPGLVEMQPLVFRTAVAAIAFMSVYVYSDGFTITSMLWSHAGFESPQDFLRFGREELAGGVAIHFRLGDVVLANAGRNAPNSIVPVGGSVRGNVCRLEWRIGVRPVELSVGAAWPRFDLSPSEVEISESKIREAGARVILLSPDSPARL